MSSVAVLGTGIMGAGMARSLLREGIDVTVWNRSSEKAKPLADDGATVADSAAEAVAGADVVVTMLFDIEPVLAVMADAAGSLRDDAVWVQASTVGIEGTRRVEAFAQEHGIDVLDAPVLGTKAPAENGKLVVLASGPSALREKVTPAFDAMGARTQWVSETLGDASKVKLAVNAWIGVMVNGTAQSIALARGLGLDPQQFLDAVDGQAVDSPYVQLKGKAMITGDYTPSFELDGVIKDTDLIRDALAEAGTATTLADAVADRLAAASAQGHGAEDMAAVVYGYGT
ncbi:NAD(P)-dependent oxidoreductase [Actinomycetospora sp. NBRC 106378]|uniref:NAD(P)-dependent oxidoreductase n=1 Tax=Actinomycetospora sp. NBRC 106378 TaxID=3032208 RepID=UPI0024A1E81F|nr:NAD(P)-dependent oxidoreductase [Actinomycetospora sp. NBRC 106378]GLZ55022.1 3-hydroxyisobutyrate dehydrogenase [Actinomycetospora sp. NBRC 106378]